MKEKKNNIWLYVVLILAVLLIGGGLCYHFYNNNNKENQENNVEEDSSKYISIVINDKKVLRKDLNLTNNAKINSSKVIDKLSIVLLDVIEPDFQFETHYLFCFDKDGKLVFEARDFKDSDNDNNRYKYNGKFEFDEKTNLLTFYTNLFLGENDEATGTAFNDKDLSELTKDEKIKLGNYSDTIKYVYKYDKKKMTFSKKEEVSKLKNNDYYKNILN